MKPHEIPLLSPQAFRERYFSPERIQRAGGFDGFYMTNTLLKSPIKAHRKTVYEFIFLTKGLCQKYKGLDNFHIHENEFFFMPAYQIAGSDSISEDAEGYYCGFDLDFFSPLLLVKELFKKFGFLQFAGHPLVKVEGACAEQAAHLLARMNSVFQEKAAGWKDTLGMYLLTLFFEIQPFYRTKEGIQANAALRLTTEFKKALYLHFKEKQKVTDYADLLAVTPNHLNKCVKSATGKATHALIQDMVVLESKVLLQQTDLPVSEIAYQFHRSPTEFSRFFKALTGVSPTEYRAMD